MNIDRDKYVTITDYTGLDIGKYYLMPSRTDKTKLVKRKLIGKSIDYNNGIRVRFKFKVSNTIYSPSTESLIKFNEGIEPFQVEVKCSLYSAIAEKDIFEATKGDQITQYIGTYNGMEVKGSRVMLGDWYLNQLTGILPSDKRYTI